MHVHVLTSLLWNKVDDKVGFFLSGWANGANVCPAFPVGVFLKQNVHVSFIFSRRNFSFVVLCGIMYPLYCDSIDQGLHLSLQKDE